MSDNEAVRGWVTADIPGAGGQLKEAPEDFEVEELPAYLPSGQGEHLFLWVEKRQVGTEPLARRLAEALGVDARDVGWAGLKDHRAVARQFFSVPAAAEPRLAGLRLEGAHVLSAARHGNKLRPGHLRGNRFHVRVRQAVDPDAAGRSLRALEERGVPNFFGEQRFGRDARNAELGRKLALGQRVQPRPSRFQRKLYLSAFQAELFNRALEARLQAGTFARALEGDVMRKEDTGGLFVCASPAEDQPRVERFEISPAGPLFGPRMPPAAGPVRAAEEALLSASGVSMEQLERNGRGETAGARRAYRVRLGEPSLQRDGNDLLLRFTLPKGSYATVVLDEIVKSVRD
ncbi:MAG TPA: tRNA pseudouridine(13) synthase TruD [Myxococcales bacterium]|nr:tRNA pseudouridine(13) synthase TruD [Myxococcales bacterium]